MRELLTGGILVVPGIYDGLGAALAERAGFQALYLSGASIAYTRFGRPDIGLVSMSEVADTLALISERSDLPLIVDADTGFGNALNVQRTVARFERDGAAAIQLEDQTLPKRCGHLAGKTIVPAAEMVGKIKAACDARRHDTIIVARTDAIAVEGLELALERAERYAEAGADVLFVEAPRDDDEMATVCRRFGGRVPLLANMVEGGSTPMHRAAELESMGYSIALFPSGLVRAQAKLTTEYFASLAEHGWNQPLGNRMLDFQGLNDLLGTADILAAGQAYDAANFERGDDD
ncbi:MAG TPA: isocitrate lyase/PEP mutase family protein [Alphaproteobacteria bacterium]|jgi:2-methylisocitrate lyase-like PEP mutase family enzyme|nr:isocitrate lyase/PEP mutase family protein [Alphaproteobacteria bacterium]MDP6271182.1 isocitrate lyase/PEP mutase family protein [Alphaproteobacteria bacterium]MDP7427591.1 isocitrate lyase/PEP mutase family protein [Alphaproteobacteria bacterium]HJM51988.1 isocitrate lyase/PEP mutase family protein [Alphaproteobacteria bacterium]